MRAEWVTTTLTLSKPFASLQCERMPAGSRQALVVGSIAAFLDELMNGRGAFSSDPYFLWIKEYLMTTCIALDHNVRYSFLVMKSCGFKINTDGNYAGIMNSPLAIPTNLAIGTRRKGSKVPSNPVFNFIEIRFAKFHGLFNSFLIASRALLK